MPTEVLNSKPGSRVTILYRLEYTEGDAAKSWPSTVITKTYRGSKGEQAYKGMLALWEALHYLRYTLQLWTKPKLSGAEAVVRLLEHNLRGMGL